MGPVCSILIEERDTGDLLSDVDNFIRRIGQDLQENSPNSWSFWIRADKIHQRSNSNLGCQFTVSISESLDEYDDKELVQIEANIGYRVKFDIQLCAGCNRSIDHLLLAKMAANLMGKLGGFIDFDGDLEDLVAGYKVQETKGQTFNIQYESENGQHQYQIADLVFLEEWLNNENFKMVK